MSSISAAPLVLNQYREGSSYKDSVGQTYHFPSRYIARFQVLPVRFVYYEPREGGKKVYFGIGVVSSVCRDTEEDGHYYADLDHYRPFEHTVDYYAGKHGEPWEKSKNMRNSVRSIDSTLFDSLVEAGGLSPVLAGDYEPNPQLHVSRAKKDLGKLYPGPTCPNDPGRLRKIQKVIESYERPSSVSNWVKQTRGDVCQLCGQRGFVKRDGARYCELHHLFHLARNPPSDCLKPEYVIVVCATCHRRLHYANVGVPKKTDEGWSVLVDNGTVSIPVNWSESTG